MQSVIVSFLDALVSVIKKSSDTKKWYKISNDNYFHKKLGIWKEIFHIHLYNFHFNWCISALYFFLKSYIVATVGGIKFPRTVYIKYITFIKKIINALNITNVWYLRMCCAPVKPTKTKHFIKSKKKINNHCRVR